MHQQPVQSIRKRARKACESCRKRKRRCDGAQPCRACIEYEYECYYAEQPQSLTTVSDQARSSTIPSHFAVPAMSRESSDGEILPHRGMKAFPQAVAQVVYGQSIPMPARHNFGYNIGMPTISLASDQVPEPVQRAMPLATAETFCQRFHDSCGLVFPVVDDDALQKELRRMWTTTTSGRATSSTHLAVTLAILLGSYFSWPLLAERHDAILLYTQQELDHLTFRQPPVGDHWLLRAWILKTLLLRMTSTPDLVWLSSCNMMHVAELVDSASTQETAFLDVTSSAFPDQKPTIFTLAWIMNQMISLESGRSAMISPNVSLSVEGDLEQTNDILNLQTTFQRIQELEIGKSTAAAKACLLELCHYRGANLNPHTFLIEACVLCGIYRHIFRKGGCFEVRAVSTIKTIFQEALTTAEKLAESNEPWFMLAEFSSQLTCVCLVLGRPLLDLLPRVLTLLRTVTKSFASEALRETERTVALLIEVCLKARDEDTTIVRKALQSLSHAGHRIGEEEEPWTQFLNQQVFD